MHYVKRSFHSQDLDNCLLALVNHELPPTIGSSDLVRHILPHSAMASAVFFLDLKGKVGFPMSL